MSYLVLARKWRPQAFADMTGQEHVVRTIANAIAQDRVAHAFLFCGPRGVGKTTAARLLARALNCEKGPTAQPCGTCRPCTEIVSGSSVDVAEIDGASNNSVEDVRQIRERVTYLPQRDRHKIYIIDEVHMLTTSAFNALLKTLEEPPPHVKFIFATTEPHKLPDTILSRCQRHNFRRIPTGMMVKRLTEIAKAEGAQISERSLSMIVGQSEGGMRDALSLLDMVISACGKEGATDEAVAEALGAIDRTAVHEIVSALIRREAKPVLSRLEELYIRGVDFKRLAEELALYLRHLIVARATGEGPEELADSEKKAVQDLAQQSDAAQLTRLFDLVHSGIWDVAKAAQPRLALEVTLLKGIHLAPGASIGELLSRVEALTRKLGTSLPSTPVADGGRPDKPTFPEAVTPRPAQATETRATPAPSNEVALAGSLRPSMSRYSATAEAPKLFAPEASPAGCASGECIPEKPAPALTMVPGFERVGALVEKERTASPERSSHRTALPITPPPLGAAESRGPSPIVAIPTPVALAAPVPVAEPVAVAPPALAKPLSAPAPAPLAKPAAEKPLPELIENPGAIWRQLVAELKAQKKDMLATALANGRLLLMTRGQVRIGYAPLEGMFRKQAERMKPEADAILTRLLGAPTGLIFETVQGGDTAASPSLAQEDTQRVQAREARIRRDSRENPAVLAAMKILGGTVEQIRVVEEEAMAQDFVAAIPEEEPSRDES